jgi:hypothetical protein
MTLPSPFCWAVQNLSKESIRNTISVIVSATTIARATVLLYSKHNLVGVTMAIQTILSKSKRYVH